MVCFCSMFNRLIYRVLSTSFSICCWAVLLSWSSLSQHLIYPNRFRFVWVCWFTQCNCWYFQCIVAITQDFCCSWWRLVTMWFLIDICSLEFYTSVSGQAQRACYNTAVHAGGLNQWWQALQCSDGLIHITSYTERHRYCTLHWLHNQDYMVASCLLFYLTVIFVLSLFYPTWKMRNCIFSQLTS